MIHILVEDTPGARRAIEEGGMEVARERDVLVLEVEDRPGVFGGICRKIANQGMNIDVAYLATSTRLVIGADDLEQARSAL